MNDKLPRMFDCTIREATEGDLEVLLALRLALQAHLERCNPSLWRISPEGKLRSKEMLTQLLQEEDSTILVAVDADQRIVGMIAGQVRQQHGYIPQIVGSVHWLFVGEAYRRRGIGRALVARLLAFFVAKGAEEITLRYVIGNVEAERFWIKLGFEPRIITAGTSLQALAARL